MVREAGDPDGSPVLYFHGTPGSRLDVAFGDGVAEDLGVRVISFDRPGYGRSDGAPFGLRRIAEDATAIVEHCELDNLTALGWSGGGPYALAAATSMGDRVRTVGIACSPGPFQQMPGLLDQLSDGDRLALSYLPDRPERAAEQFCVGSELMVAVRDDERALMSGMDALFGDVDADVLSDAVVRHCLFRTTSEALRQGFAGVGWDNVAWVGEWDVDVTTLRCPVELWYGGADASVPSSHGEWFERHLPSAALTIYPGEGHLLPLRHWRELLSSLVRDD